MKKAKKILCTLLAVVMCVMSVPMEGVKEIDFSRLDFGIRASAESRGKANSVDYSNLTANQYMAKVLLNSNYYGCQSGETTIPQQQLDIYRNPLKVSNARTLVNELRRNNSFMSSVAAWEVLTFDPSDLVDDVLQAKDYYVAVIMSILDVQMKDNTVLKNLNNEYSSFVLKTSKNILSILKDITGINISDDKTAFQNLWNDLTDEQLQTLYTQLANDRELKTYYEYSGKGMSFVSNTLSLCTSAYDMAKMVGSYIMLGRMGQDIKDVLDELYKNCPSSNSYMKIALKETSEICNDALKASIISVSDIGTQIVSYAFSKIVGEMWSGCLKTAVGGFVGGMMIGQAIGKNISNFMFSTDKIIEQYYAMNALVEFEDVMLVTLTSLGNRFKANESESNADAFMQCIKMLFSTYTLGYSYATDFVEKGKERGLYNTIKSLVYGTEQSIEDYKKTLNYMSEMVNDMKEFLTTLEGYSAYYEDDAPSAYQDIFKDKSASVITTISSYSPSFKPNIYSPAINNKAWLTYEKNSDGYMTITSCYIGATGSIEIPEGVAGKRVTHIAYNAFKNCTGVTEVVLPRFMTEIGGYAFSGCSNLSKITLNDGLKTIGYSAFYGTALTSVTIPKTVTTMGDSSGSPFEGIDTLKTVIFSYGMLKIPSYALRNVTSVTSVSLPNGITEIGNYAFSGCTGLTTLYLTITIEKINNSAFYNCTNIASVNYIGNQEKWNQISIGSNNEPITNATINYNYNHSTHTYYPSITKDALCLETGVMTYSCFCGASYTSTIPAKGHQMGEYALVKAATCKEKGEERSYCELCGTFVSREIDYAAHTDGNKDKICDLCGEPSTSIIDCGVFGEDYEDYENLTWTLYTDGELIISGTGRMNSKYIPWSSYCEKITSLVICEGVTNIVSSAFADCEHLSEVSLPTTLTEIGDFAFLNTEIMNNANNYIDNVLYVDDYLITVLDDDNADIVDFTIKPGTRVVADFALFDVSYNFKGTFTIPESVINLGDNLKYLHTVSKFNVDNSNKYYSNDSNGILYNKDKTVLVRCPEETFDSDNVLKNSKFEIPNTVIEIANDACSSCKFSEVAIPESVIKIGDRAFSSSNIKSFTIGNSIESMGLSVFGHTPWFAAQPYGEIYAGNVFCDYKIKNHNITEINIKPGTTVIAEGALGYQPYEFSYDYLKVEELILPEGIKIIGEGAFSSLRDLKKVSIPSTIEKVYGFNFQYCKKLEVNYNGTSESWSKVSIDIRNDKLINATINFIDDAPSHTHSPKAITIPASCTVDGMTYKVCSVCGEPIGTSTIIPAAHTPGDWEITIEATYEAEGKRVKKCTVCHEVIKSEVIPKLVNTTVTDEKTGIEIKYTGNKYDGDVGVTVTETFDGSAFQLINTVGATSSKVYDITLTVNGESIQPKGKVTVKIPLPSGYNPNQSYVYHVNTNTGAVEKMPARYENGYMVFETDHFSYYAVIEIHEHTFSGSVCSTCGYDRSAECTCNCHKGGISGFFFKLINFFQKLFGNNKVCACGKVH